MVFGSSPAVWCVFAKARCRFFFATIIFTAIICQPSSGFCQSEIKIAGKVIDSVTGSPVPGAVVSITNVGRTSVTAIGGEFYFNDIPKGDYKLTAKRLGYRQSEEFECSVGPYLTESITIFLTPAPLEVEGQRVSASESGQLVIRRNGNIIIIETGEEGLLSIDDLETELPEIEVVQSGAEKYLRIRGANLNATEIKLNGRRINSVLTSKGDISSIPMGSVKRIEFIKGGSYRTSGIAGSVNFITVSEPEKFTISSGVETGSFDRNKYFARLNEWRLFGLAFGLDVENCFDRGDFEYTGPRGSIKTRENNYYHDKKLFGYISRKNVGSGFVFNMKYFKRDSGVPGQVFQPTPDASSAIYEKEVSLKYDNRLSSKIALDITAGFADRSIEHESPRTPVNFIPFKSKFEENSRDIAARFQYSGGVDFNVGGESRYESLDGEDLIRSESSFGRHSRIINSVWSGAVLRPKEFEKLKNKTIISLGARYESGAGGGFFAPSTTIRLLFDFPMNPALDFSWFKARRLPDMTDLFWKEDVFAAPNPELKAERSQGYEIGFDLNIEKTVPAKFRLSKHFTAYDDLIIWRRWAGNRFKPVNLSKAEIDGWEFSARSNPFSGPVVLFWIASFIRPLNKESEPSHNNKILTFRPVGSQTAGFEISLKGVEMKLVGRHIGKRYLTEENTKSLPPVDLLDVRIGYSLDMSVIEIDMRFELLNIGNIQYEILDRQPERPREYRLSLTVTK